MPIAEAIERVRVWLGWEPGDVEPLMRLAKAGCQPGRFTLPRGSEMGELLVRLNVPEGAQNEIAEAVPGAGASPEAWWLLEHLHHGLTDHRAAPSPPPWPAPQPGEDPLTRYFHLYAFLGAVPDVLRLHGGRRIPPTVTWGTLSDIGPQVENHKLRHGYWGFDGAMWIWEHFRGEVFRLGRLQYTVGDDLAVHIPADGPLTPEACDESLALAAGFFRGHFPERSYRRAVCTSWLLDPQLSAYLPSSSNILRFQERFTPVPGKSVRADDAVVKYVFGFTPERWSDLPRRSTLERAIVAHLENGGHWEFHRGWLTLPSV